MTLGIVESAVRMRDIISRFLWKKLMLCMALYPQLELPGIWCQRYCLYVHARIHLSGKKDTPHLEKKYSHRLKRQMLKTNVMFRSGVEMKVQLGRGGVVWHPMTVLDPHSSSVIYKKSLFRKIAIVWGFLVDIGPLTANANNI
jgi:hypothetical protein